MAAACYAFRISTKTYPSPLADAQVSVTDADGNEVHGEGVDEKEPLGDGDEPLTMTTYMVVPPDGGWGWVVVAASFMCNLIVDGIIFTFGMLRPSLVKQFGVSESQVNLVGSLQSGFYLMAGKSALRFSRLRASLYAAARRATLAEHVRHGWRCGAQCRRCRPLCPQAPSSRLSLTGTASAWSPSWVPSWVRRASRSRPW